MSNTSEKDSRLKFIEIINKYENLEKTNAETEAELQEYFENTNHDDHDDHDDYDNSEVSILSDLDYAEAKFGNLLFELFEYYTEIEDQEKKSNKLKEEKTKRITLWVSDEFFDNVDTLRLIIDSKGVNDTVVKCVKFMVEYIKHHEDYWELSKAIKTIRKYK